jgi:hypothetical protein
VEVVGAIIIGKGDTEVIPIVSRGFESRKKEKKKTRLTGMRRR